MSKITSVIIPAYNEGPRIINTLNTLKDLKDINNIYVIDDGSTDDTFEKASELDFVKVIKQPFNSGKGAALKRGVKEAMLNSDIIVFLDADLEATAAEAIKLINPIIQDKTDITIAKFPPTLKKGGLGLVKGLTQWGLYLHTGQRLHTALSGQRAFKVEVLKELEISNSGFGIELSMLIDLLKKGYQVMEVDVDMGHRETGRDISGFYHRGRQFYHISKVIINKFLN